MIASLAGMMGAVGCGSSGKEARGEEKVIGAPPSEGEDPFQMMTTPEDASEVSSSGYIGPEEGDEQEDEKEGSPEDEPVAVEASRAKPEDGATEPPPKPEGSGVRCFSCVRICPVDEASRGAECAGGERDVICGWGVHGREADAARLAKAECDGALDMARRMKTWSRIEGECPPATCR